MTYLAVIHSQNQCAIFINTLGNAVKFTEERGKVTLQADSPQPDLIRVSITDSGIGMTAQEIDIAMLPFGQVSGGLSKAHEGTGLGLPISASLVQMHGGTMNIHSVKNKGTTVIITLPAGEEETNTAPDKVSVASSENLNSYH